MTAGSPCVSIRRELDHRCAHGIDVTLSWSPARNTLFVTVVEDTGESFELTAAPHEALDVSIILMLTRRTARRPVDAPVWRS